MRPRLLALVIAQLRGFFPDKWSGRVHLHFAILLAEPDEALNVAFAIEQGIYDLMVRAEGNDEPIVLLAGQANPVTIGTHRI